MPEQKTQTQRAIDAIREDERAKIAAWLDTLPWKGPGSLHTGEIAEAIRRGDHTKDTSW